MTTEELEAEVQRLNAIIDRNKCSYLALQDLARRLQVEVASLTRKLGARAIVAEMFEESRRRQARSMEEIGEAMYDELAKRDREQEN